VGSRLVEDAAERVLRFLFLLSTAGWLLARTLYVIVIIKFLRAFLDWLLNMLG
jgi:hypothetical protein